MKTSTGLDLRTEIAAFVYSTEDLPLQSVLAYCGFELNHTAPNESVDLGASYSASDSGLTLKSVKLGGSAHASGLSAGDCIIAIDGFKATGDYLKQLLGRKPVGDTSEVLSFRKDRLQTHTLAWHAASPQEWQITEKKAEGETAATLTAPWRQTH